MKLLKERRAIVFRKETFEVLYHFWQGETAEEQFTTTALDEINIGQAYNQFRSRHKLPFPDEIQEIREQYGLSATKMAEILGFGTNVYRQYEAGEVPSESNARLIQLAKDPERFRSLVALCTSLDEKTLEKLRHRLDYLEQMRPVQPPLESYLMGALQPDEFSGYRRPNFKRFVAMVSAFSKAMQPWKTKLNKLLFYADFIHFAKTCNSISGMRYDAIKLGPVPHNFQGLYQLMADQDAIAIEYTAYENGSIGERFAPKDAAEDILNASEMETIQAVIERFRKASNQDIIFESHLEKAWRENVDQPNRMISYQKYGFELGQA